MRISKRQEITDMTPKFRLVTPPRPLCYFDFKFMQHREMFIEMCYNYVRSGPIYIFKRHEITTMFETEIFHV
jgi:hypothetical protein